MTGPDAPGTAPVKPTPAPRMPAPAPGARAAKPGRAPSGSGIAGGLRDLARPYRGQLALVGACVIAAAFAELIPTFVVRHVIDANLTPRSTAGLGAAAAAYLGALSLVAGLTAAYGYQAAAVAQRALATLRTRLFAHLLALPAAYHDATPTGDSISRATTDVEAIDNLFSSSAAKLLGETFRLGSVLVAMAALSLPLTGMSVLVIPPLAVLVGFLRRRIRAAERATRLALAAIATDVTDDLAGAEVIRAFARQRAFGLRFRRVVLGWLCAVNRSTYYNAFFAPALGVLSAAMTALLLWAGAGHALDAAGITLGTLTAFVLLFGRFFAPLINLGDEWQTVQAALAGAERVFAVLAIPVATEPCARSFGVNSGPDSRRSYAHPNGGVSLPDGAAGGVGSGSGLSISHVTFGYAPGRPILCDVSLGVAPGEHVAVVGRTGAGKSTLLALVAGLYVPGEGEIRVVGQEPDTLTDDERAALLGYVPQQVTLFTGTVLDNLTLGDAAVPADQVRRAAAVTGADRFIAALPRGYDTVLSDSARGAGTQLSAGQRQLLALTRAIATRPAVLLLDEATAVVDGASDAAFRAALRSAVLPQGTAVLTVAHRLATARDADRVVVMAHGRIVEAGPPGELLAAGGPFAALTALEEAGWDWRDMPDLPPTLPPDVA